MALGDHSTPRSTLIYQQAGRNRAAERRGHHVGSPGGQRFTFAERIAEIFSRYGEGSIVQRSIARARPVLAASVDRTTERLSATAQPR
jgi:hypothetical protein